MREIGVKSGDKPEEEREKRKSEERGSRRN